MTGASSKSVFIEVVNANWVPGPGGDDGAFAFLLVTADGQRFSVEDVSAGEATAVMALCASGARLMWDPVNSTLIAGGLVGTWFESRPS